MKPNKKYDHGYAILREDFYAREPPIVVKVLRDADRCATEVKRLNTINFKKGSIYSMQVTRVEKDVR